MNVGIVLPASKEHLRKTFGIIGVYHISFLDNIGQEVAVRGGNYKLKGMVFAAILVFAIPTFTGHEFTSVAFNQVVDAIAGESPGLISETRAVTGGATPPRPEASVIGLHNPRVAKWSSSPLSGPIQKPPVANFGIVEEGILYRSAQPTASDYRWLRDNGFKSIVSFRREKGDNREEVLNYGFDNYLFVDIEDETNPSDAQAEQFLDFVTDSRNWPILIHCKVGLGRTGTLAALVRYAVDGWTMDRALHEARLYRGGIDLVPSQVAWLKDWETRHPPACHRPTLPSSAMGG